MAPFAKTGAVRRLAEAVAPSVALRVVLRWLPEDIAAGVSDLAVWELIKRRSGGQLFVRTDLHAKYYRGDKSRLVGSANLTNTALGWCVAPNLEILTPLVGDAELDHFETTVFEAAVEVDDEMVARIEEAASRLPRFRLVSAEQEATDAVRPNDVARYDRWIPSLRRPEDLYLAYAGRGQELSAVSTRVAQDDLQVLRIPPGLDERDFRLYVGVMLMRSPLMHRLQAFLSAPRRFGEVRDYLADALGLSTLASREWQVIFRWLMYFCPDKYEYHRPRHSEIIAPRAGLGR